MDGHVDQSGGTAAKVAIVTGAASGIGKELAKHLLSLGWRVACCDLQQEAGQEFVSGKGDQAQFFPCNVADYDDQVRVFSQVWQKWGRLDALLANAGHSDRGSIYILDQRQSSDIPPKPALLSTDVCYKGFLYGVQLAIHFMRKNAVPGGAIVATSTIASVHPHQTFPEYCGAKAAVREILRLGYTVIDQEQINQFVRTAAPVLKLKDNITLNAVLPGIVATGAVPQASIDATAPEYITPIETVVTAYARCLDDRDFNGQLIECSTDKHFVLPPPSMANGPATKRACTVWEPLFEKRHHECSGLPDAIL